MKMLTTALLVAAHGVSLAAPKDDTARANLERELRSRYVFARMASGKAGVAEPGNVVLLQVDNLRAVPANSLKSYANTFRNGRFQYSMTDALIQSKETLRTFGPGTDFFLLRVDVKDNAVNYNLITCSPYDNMFYMASVSFPFPKGFAASADAGQIQQIAGQVLAPAGNAGADNQVAGGQAPPPPEPAPPAPPPPSPPAAAPPPAPVTIILGQTTEQVATALGQPEKVVDLSTKLIYYYKDMKVTFVNGKVSDVQ
jgi:hypothetical protein